MKVKKNSSFFFVFGREEWYRCLWKQLKEKEEENVFFSWKHQTKKFYKSINDMSLVFLSRLLFVIYAKKIEKCFIKFIKRINRNFCY